MLLLAMFAGFTHHYLNAELHRKTWQRDYPDHPDWKLHGSYSEAEVDDIMKELVETSVIYGVPATLIAVVVGWLLSRQSLRPIARLNDQLHTIRAANLSQRIELPEIDAEFRDLVRHLNELLGRLDRAFTDMSEYAARVAHELRTPLAILRLKVEQAGERIPPELAEQLQAELHQLTHVVDQSLLIAKAEQGRLKINPRAFDLAALVHDVAEDFALLAQEDDRAVKLSVRAGGMVWADPKHARQILHNLFTNALKHGQGEIRVKLTRRDHGYALTLANRIRPRTSAQPDALGLGLRVVETLLSLQPELKCQRRRNARVYVVKLHLPAASG
jgi:signal transduction histidine kinase